MPENTNAVREIRFHITRYNPESDPAPYMKTYPIPVREGMTVLDGLHYIKDNLDSTLAWRYSCRMGICGSCGMLLNGRPGLACNTFAAKEKKYDKTAKPVELSKEAPFKRAPLEISIKDTAAKIDERVSAEVRAAAHAALARSRAAATGVAR